MRRQTFNEYIESRQFRELFISEMGWNNMRGQAELPLYIIDEKEVQITAIAERNGFQILQCEVDEIPTSSFCKKLDLKLRRNANDYILIFFLPDELHHLWVAPVKKIEKRDLVFIEYQSLPQADFLYSKIDELSFELDEKTTIMDVKQRIGEAFIVNSEKLTKDFYAGFKKEHTAFVKFISGIDDQIEDKKNRKKQWYASVMLNRLMFCYFIQKKGFLDLNTNYLREKLLWVQKEKGEDRFFQSFYRGFLTALFHDGLNAPKHDREFESKYGRIPYLNGGMFDEHELEQDYADIDIADEAFEQLFAFFDKWHWHLDDRHTASGKDINPDVLGYIFEQYINDRAAMGAYYTKEDITEYIGKNCILPFLMDKTKSATSTSAKDFKEDGFVWTMLKQSGDRYIYDAVKQGYSSDWRERIPSFIAEGIDTTKPNLLERRARWNEKTTEPFCLPTEIWRETVERLQRCESLIEKIEKGDIHEINDFITYNLDIRQFVYDLLANASDHSFVAHFYHALQKVTILDPTCGSGAFLFAAMNILEPLYEICIERMEMWNQQNPNLFKDEIYEINKKYRSNRQYFIFKSIILRNLYGVDIMVEATEIAKLRLFLKMVAVVDVDVRADNLGLDPLPDIDFNIRCGNTLVGYATAQELEQDLTYGDMFANAEFRSQVKDGMKKSALAFERFKEVQFKQDEDMEAFKEAKQALRFRLKNLTDTLNRKMYSAITGGSIPFDEWEKSHQPFHWLAEFYEIIQGNGGFDVIIGNPPYVETSEIDYSINFCRNNYGNLYAYCTERCAQITMESSKIGLIVPMSVTSIREYKPLRRFLQKRYNRLFFTNHSIRPTSLFNGISQRVSIVIASIDNNAGIYTTKYLRSKDHSVLFQVLQYSCGQFDDERDMILPKVSSYMMQQIWDKFHTKKKDLMAVVEKRSSQIGTIYYKDYGETYWIFPFSFCPWLTPVKSYKEMYIQNSFLSKFFCVTNSSLFYIYHTSISDCWHLGNWHFAQFPISIKEIVGFDIENLSSSYQANRITRFDKRAKGEIYEYKVNKSKPIIDEIDIVLAKHYGFTEEELDFIINYDIKYRMGDNLNEESEE